MTQLPIIGITMGDAAGIGPELCARVLSNPAVAKLARLRVYGDVDLIHKAASICHIRLSKGQLDSIVQIGNLHGHRIPPGQIQARCGDAAYQFIEAATRAAMSGEIDAVATCPIHKQAMKKAGITHPGHTELLQELTRAKDSRMMFMSDELMVSLVTIHHPLNDVAPLITAARVHRTIELTHAAMQALGHKKPRLTVLGLNPHAGEGGLLGKEDQKNILPAIEKARRKGWLVEGPIPPDTAFTPSVRSRSDAYVAMYHDQGLIPFKMVAFEKGVNVTLGLPIVRTSVDHGTAYDIAWKGKASPTSLIEAIRWAVRLADADGASQKHRYNQTGHYL